MIKDIKLPNYSKKEEQMNFITHLVGVGFGIIVLITFIICMFLKKIKLIDSLALIIYALSMITLFLMSSLYHGIKNERYKKIFRLIDHSTIYFLIAGTYTPICLIALKGVSIGTISMIVVWISALVGILLNMFLFNKKITSVVSMLIYVIAGWIIIFGVKDVINYWGMMGFLWTLIGGIIYTIGILFYGLGKQKPYRHAIWHIFVILGSLIQFLGIFLEIVLVY